MAADRLRTTAAFLDDMAQADPFTQGRMTMDTLTHAQAAEAFIATLPLNMRPSIHTHDGGRYGVSCYWPNGDVIRDVGCHGIGATLEDAAAAMWADVRKAEAAGKKLSTAAECKAAVIDLIREHDAAPASFRDAVDNLKVR